MTAIGVAHASTAQEAPALDRLGGFKGECRALTIAGRPARCASQGGIVYLHLRNARTIWMVGLADGKSALAFIGEGDGSDPVKGQVLPLTRVRSGANPKSSPVPVTGECRFSASGDKPEQLVCEARDGKGREFRLDFQADGTPFDLKRF